MEHPPHVHRLLRLIREGTPSHASRASALLGRYAASCCRGGGGGGGGGGDDDDDCGSSIARPDVASVSSDPGTTIWDLIGRLVGGDDIGNGNNDGIDEEDGDDGTGKAGGGGGGGGKGRHGRGGGRGGERSRRRGRGAGRKKDRRPKSGLFDPNWSTRANCALALERVARRLPAEDRRHFFEGGDDDDDDDDGDAQDGDDGEGGVSLWLDVHDLRRNEAVADDDDDETDPRGDRLPAARRNRLDVVAERGRPLLSSSGEEYDWDVDEGAREYVREREALRDLDATAATIVVGCCAHRRPSSGGDGSTTEIAHQQKQQQQQQHQQQEQKESFLKRRVALQRRILARRLGLGGMLNAPILDIGHLGPTPEEEVSSSGIKKRRRIIDDIVDDEDLAPGIDREVPTSKKEGKKAAGKERSGKRKPADKSEPTHGGNEKTDGGISIRALLVFESRKSSATREGGGGSDYRPKRAARHRNPQTLLGSELAYRTFDPDWSVRHGALLGTLALLRAWNVHASSSRRTTAKFGRWPRDILARCVCILALDQFADFSGVSCDGGGGGHDDDADGIPSGAIVAPVREMAAQIVAILLEAACPETRVCAHDLLVQLYTRQCRIAAGRDGWEVRHGVLLAWKYVCAIALFHSNMNGQSQTPSLNNMYVDARGLRPLSAGTKMTLDEHKASPHCHSTLNNIILQSIRGLSDVSDDNRAVAAQVIRLSLLLDSSLHTIDIAKESSKSLWQAIMTIRGGVSSCAADLLHLLAELLSRDCTSFILCLQDVMGSLSLGSILHKLIEFIDDDSTHVKISCYCALCLVAEPIAKAIFNGDDTIKSDCNSGHFRSMSDCATALSRLLVRIFETYSMPAYTFKGDLAACKGDATNDESAGELSKSRNQAWSAILGAIDLLTQSNSADARFVVDDTFIELILRYFGIFRSLHPSKDNLNRPSSYIFTRLPYPVGVRESDAENSFVSLLTSSHALSQFFGKIYSENRPSFLSDTICSTLQSPWFSQCEAGYILHISISSSVESGCPFFAKYLPTMLNALEVHPVCTLIVEHAGFNAALDDTNVQSICDTGLAMLLDSGSHRSSDDVVQLWEKTFITARGISLEDLRKSSRTSLTEASMRSSAFISGALIACGSQHLPVKVTSLIRALMTSLKNEVCHSRRVETCRHISKLVSILSEKPTYEKARNKLMESVCVLASSTDANQKGAEHVIELLVGGMSTTDNLEDFTPIWQRLSPLMNNTFPKMSAQEISDSINMLRVVSNAMSKKKSSFKCAFELFLGSAAEVACLSDSEPLQVQANASIRNFCNIDFIAAMDLIVPSLVSHLSDLQNNQGREGGCKLLLSILHEFEVLASPYVTALLPIAMRLMTDAVVECARLAASAFAILVRIAPLAAGHIEKSGHESLNQNVGQEVSNDVVRHLILGKPLPPCAVPETILSYLGRSGTTLRPYQMEGISWLRFLADVHLNGALCDDMGLGKTLQALIAVAISHHGKTSGGNDFATSNPRSLVICPSSVVGHWMKEINVYFPGKEIFAPFDFTGSAKSRRIDWRDRFQQSTIVVTSYSVLRNDIDILENVSWDWIILDEGHLLKNPKTSTAKASRRLKSHHKLILTGTPIQNNVHEIWATFDFLLPNFLGTESNFLREFAKPIVKSQSSGASAADTYQGMESLKILHQQVLPFILRREKSQVIRELPPKIITDVPCSLSKQQYIMYQQTLKRSGMKEALDMVDDSMVGDATCTPKIGSHVLASLLQLRLICTHPLLHTLTSKTDREASPCSFTRLDCSGKLSVLNDLLRHAGIAEPEIAAADNDESGYLIDLSENTSDNGGDVDYDENDDFDDFGDDSLAINSSKCLVFAQFTQSLDIVERMLFEPHMPSLQYLRLDGRVPEKQRSAVVDRFNQDPDIRILLLTTKVGGLGLNLTGADKVIFLEPDWNPFVDLQAMDRAHRIGQTRTVNVYRLITSDTIEEKMMELQGRKKATSEAVVNSDNSTMCSMGTDRLLDIFTCRGGSGTAASSRHGEAGDDNVLSYLDNGSSEEYSSLSVDGFLRGLA